MSDQHLREQFQKALEQVNKEANERSPIKFQCPHCQEEFWTTKELSADAYVLSIATIGAGADLSIQTIADALPTPKALNDILGEYELPISKSVVAAGEKYVPGFNDANITNGNKCGECGYPIHDDGDADLIKIVENN